VQPVPYAFVVDVVVLDALPDAVGAVFHQILGGRRRILHALGHALGDGLDGGSDPALGIRSPVP
jgi:hypothetical protein